MNEYIFNDAHGFIRNTSGRGILTTRQSVFLNFILSNCHLVNETRSDELLQGFELHEYVRGATQRVRSKSTPGG